MRMNEFLKTMNNNDNKTLFSAVCNTINAFIVHTFDSNNFFHFFDISSLEKETKLLSLRTVNVSKCSSFQKQFLFIFRDNSKNDIIVATHQSFSIMLV